MVQSKHASRAQKHLSVERICKSTLSDFNRLIDSERLVPIIGSLHSQLSAQQVGRPQTADGLSELLRDRDITRLAAVRLQRSCSLRM